MDGLRRRSSAVILSLIASVGLLSALPERARAADPAVSPAASTAANGPSAVESARRRVSEGQLPAALAQLAAYVAANPKELAPALYLGDLYYRSSNLPAAESTYLGILRYAPDSRETHDRLGGTYAAEDRINDAIAQFTLSLPLSSAYGHLVDLHRRIGDLKAFEGTFVQAAMAGPDDPASLFALGAVYNAERRPQEAIPYLQRALVLTPGSCSVLSQLGDAYLNAGDGEHASVLLQQCLSIDPHDYDALVDLSCADLRIGGLDAAAASLLDRAVAERPDSPEAYVDLGLVQDHADHWQNAIALYLKAIGLDPFERDAYVDLGYDYMSNQLYPLAEAAILKGLSVSPGDGRLHFVLGLTYSRQGKRDLARAEYQRATSGDEPEIVRAATEDLAKT